MDEDENAVAARVALAAARKKVGSFKALGEILGVSPQAIAQWRWLPPKHVVKIADLTGTPPHLLRHDVFPPPRVPADAPVASCP